MDLKAFVALISASTIWRRRQAIHAHGRLNLCENEQPVSLSDTSCGPWIETALAGCRESEGQKVIVPRYYQRTVYEGIYRSLIPDQKQLLWERWMLRIDSLLEDDELIEMVHEALGRRRPRSRTRGRRATPSEVVLQLMVLKHMKNWSYETLEREVRANLVYRDFTRIGGEAVPDAKTMVRLKQALGPEVTRRIHQRVVQLAQQEKIVTGRRMRLDTTVVETNIHYPTDSTLLGDGARVLTRIMKSIEAEVGRAGTKVRDRLRSVGHRLVEIGRASRDRGEDVKYKQASAYRKLMSITRRIVGQAKVVIKEVRRGIKKAADLPGQLILDALARQLKDFSALTNRVLEQTKARVIQGNTHFKDKLLSIFETETEAIRKGKAAKPTEFGKMVKIQEAENQIVTDYEVFQQRPADQTILMPAIKTHKEIFDRAPELVAGDAGFFSAENEANAKEAGVKKVAVPNKQTRSPLQPRNSELLTYPQKCWEFERFSGHGCGPKTVRFLPQRISGDCRKPAPDVAYAPIQECCEKCNFRLTVSIWVPDPKCPLFEF